jgi:hypothetical protein
VYAQVRHMRIISASLILFDVQTRDRYEVHLSDGINNLSLVDVGRSAGPVKVGNVMRVTIEPVNEMTGR